MHRFDEINGREKGLCIEGSKGKEAGIEWMVYGFRERALRMWYMRVWGQISTDLRANLRERALMPDLPLEVAWSPCHGSWRALCRYNDSDLERWYSLKSPEGNHECTTRSTLPWSERRPDDLGRFCFPKLVHLDGDLARCGISQSDDLRSLADRWMQSHTSPNYTMKICLIFEQNKNCHWGNGSLIWGVLIT